MSKKYHGINTHTLVQMEELWPLRSREPKGGGEHDAGESEGFSTAPRICQADNARARHAARLPAAWSLTPQPSHPCADHQRCLETERDGGRNVFSMILY